MISTNIKIATDQFLFLFSFTSFFFLFLSFLLFYFIFFVSYSHVVSVFIYIVMKVAIMVCPHALCNKLLILKEEKEIFIQNSDGLYTSYFYHIIKTYI